jgi:polyhydroxyalkanoate synthesis regulator phasin
MFDAIKKSLLLSLGSAVVTKEKIEEATRHLVERGKMSKEDSEKLSQALLESGENQWEDIRSDVKDSIKKGLENLDICSKKEFEDLKMRVENMEKRLSLLEAKLVS